MTTGDHTQREAILRLATSTADAVVATPDLQAPRHLTPRHV